MAIGRISYINLSLRSLTSLKLARDAAIAGVKTSVVLYKQQNNKEEWRRCQYSTTLILIGL
ncbi:hypothetical protein [Fischerella sp. PCC 9605]|uniref:hypothetical protein n=1 Tax=Fischerella sp. PCC 9605 TaxID=1173024 RepID=UPI0004B7A89A|nr:hypothetical protein [Fischerella sp. PCC 9605]